MHTFNLFISTSLRDLHTSAFFASKYTGSIKIYVDIHVLQREKWLCTFVIASVANLSVPLPEEMERWKHDEEVVEEEEEEEEEEENDDDEGGEGGEEEELKQKEEEKKKNLSRRRRRRRRT